MAASRSVEAIWRIESARVVATLARHTGNLALAEDLAQDALVAALEQWPAAGIPERPAAWLVTVGKRRFIDQLRRRAIFESKQDHLAREIDRRQQDLQADADRAEEDIEDDVLRLVFVVCHPVLSPEARVVLTLKVVGGLCTEEIAHAFLAEPATVAQRIVRAKRTLAEARVPFELPAPDRLGERVASVLEVVYLVFNEGYVATSGSWTRPELCREALRLGRILAELLPGVAEVHGLVALMEIQASRLRARINSSGEPVLLADQDRGRWDQLLVARGLAALERAAGLGQELGPYGLQAAIAACHARAASLADTDWRRISALYDALGQVSPSPVVDLNRAVALSMAYGPQTGLDALDAIPPGALDDHHLVSAVRGDLLEKLGRLEEARQEFERASFLTRNEGERELLSRRVADLAGRHT